jgi:hypothetical protein
MRIRWVVFVLSMAMAGGCSSMSAQDAGIDAGDAGPRNPVGSYSTEFCTDACECLSDWPLQIQSADGADQIVIPRQPDGHGGVCEARGSRSAGNLDDAGFSTDWTIDPSPARPGCPEVVGGSVGYGPSPTEPGAALLRVVVNYHLTGCGIDVDHVGTDTYTARVSARR